MAVGRLAARAVAAYRNDLRSLRLADGFRVIAPILMAARPGRKHHDWRLCPREALSFASASFRSTALRCSTVMASASAASRARLSAFCSVALTVASRSGLSSPAARNVRWFSPACWISAREHRLGHRSEHRKPHGLRIEARGGGRLQRPPKILLLEGSPEWCAGLEQLSSNLGVGGSISSERATKSRA